jgi:hypothetical protein
MPYRMNRLRTSSDSETFWIVSAIGTGLVNI